MFPFHLLNRTVTGNVICPAGWNTAHCSVNPLFQVALALTFVLQLNDESLPLIEADIVYQGELSPPVCCSVMVEQTVINICYKLAITKPVEFTYTHFNTPCLRLVYILPHEHLISNYPKAQITPFSHQIV